MARGLKGTTVCSDALLTAEAKRLPPHKFIISFDSLSNSGSIYVQSGDGVAVLDFHRQEQEGQDVQFTWSRVGAEGTTYSSLGDLLG